MSYKNKKLGALIIPLEDLSILENQADILDATQALEETEKLGSLPLAKFKKQLHYR